MSGANARLIASPPTEREVVMKKFVLALAIIAGITAPAFSDERSSADVRQFERQNPPPGPRSDYVIDHKDPLRNGGTNDQSNLQWQTKSDAKAKDRIECDGHRCGH
jgi:hypothetical protein